MMMAQVMNCMQCGVIPSHGFYKGTFCSAECWFKHEKSVHKVLNCRRCHCIINALSQYDDEFCSKNCHDRFEEEKKQARRCLECGSVFLKGVKYSVTMALPDEFCSERCRDITRSKEPKCVKCGLNGRPNFETTKVDGQWYCIAKCQPKETKEQEPWDYPLGKKVVILLDEDLPTVLSISETPLVKDGSGKHDLLHGEIIGTSRRKIEGLQLVVKLLQPLSLGVTITKDDGKTYGKPELNQRYTLYFPKERVVKRVWPDI